MWQCDQSTLTLVVLKIENKIKQNKRKIKMKSKIDKTKSTVCELDTNHIMQAGILDWEKSEKDKMTILREEKSKMKAKKEGNIRKIEGKSLREVTVKIVLERIDTQEGITVEVLLDSKTTELVISLEFAKK